MSIPCPHCDRPVRIPDRSLFNADQYGKTNVTVTECCGKPVTVTPIRSYRIEPYAGTAVEDDWGQPFQPIRQPRRVA